MKKLTLKKEVVAQLTNRQNVRGGAEILPGSGLCPPIIHTDNTYCNCVTLYPERCEVFQTQACGGNETRNCPTAGCPPIFSQTCVSVDRCPATENNCNIEI